MNCEAALAERMFAYLVGASAAKPTTPSGPHSGSGGISSAPPQQRIKGKEDNNYPAMRIIPAGGTRSERADVQHHDVMRTLIRHLHAGRVGF